MKTIFTKYLIVTSCAFALTIGCSNPLEQDESIVKRKSSQSGSSNQQGEPGTPEPDFIDNISPNDRGNDQEQPQPQDLGEMIAGLVPLLKEIDRNSIAVFGNDLMAMDGIITQVDRLLTDSNQAYQTSSAARTQGITSLLNALGPLAESKKADRDELFRQVQQNEVQLIENLFFEGPAVLLKWDAHIAKSDVVREQFVIPELMNVKAAMYNERAGLLVANKEAVAQAIDLLIQSNIELANATAPSFLFRTLKVIVQLETRKAMMDPMNTELLQAFDVKLEAAKRSLKLPFDLVDSTMFDQLVDVETQVITARETSKALTALKEKIIGYGTSQADYINQLAGVFGEALGAAQALQGKEPMSARNTAIITQSMAVTLGLIPVVNISFAEARRALGNIATKLQNQEDEQRDVAILTEKETEIMGMMMMVSGTLQTLHLLMDSSLGCSKGEEVKQGPIILTPINCGLEKEGIVISGFKGS